MRRLTTILTLLIVSCTGDNDSSTDKTHDQHDKLIAWMNEFVMDDGEHATPYYTDHGNFIKPNFSTDYKTDTLTVTTLIEINSCAETVADIKISNDTLYLLTRCVSDEACASVTFNKFTYVIYNPDNKEFLIKSEK